MLTFDLKTLLHPFQKGNFIFQPWMFKGYVSFLGSIFHDSVSGCRFFSTSLVSIHLRSPKQLKPNLSEPRKNPLTFHCTGCLIVILIMVYYNPHITGQYHTLNHQGFFIAHFCWKKWLRHPDIKGTRLQYLKSKFSDWDARRCAVGNWSTTLPLNVHPLQKQGSNCRPY